jgi:high-affinity iron transporter
MGGELFDFAVTTIFAREVLEAAIIIGEYRTIVIRGDSLQPGISPNDALRAITNSTLLAAVLAVLLIAVVAISLGVLSHSFDSTTSNIIEGISKIVAAVCLLGLSLKLPRWLGVIGSPKSRRDNAGEEGLSLRSIRFNVMWNIWREVAECGVFLIPFFLTGDELLAIPLSAVVGSTVGLLCGLGIYWANRKLTNKLGLTVFAVLMLVFLAAGLFSGGCHYLEIEIKQTAEVWKISGTFWSATRLPMTILKPFGYTDTRTVLEIASFWSWLALSAVLHYFKVRRSLKIDREQDRDQDNSTESNRRSDDSGSQPDSELGLAKDDTRRLAKAEASSMERGSTEFNRSDALGSQPDTERGLAEDGTRP